MRHGYEKNVKNVMDLRTHHKNIPPLPIDVGKAVVQEGRPNSVCGLSVGPSHGRTRDDELKKMSHSYAIFVKIMMNMKTRHQIIIAAACCCWQGGDAVREG